MSSEIFRRNTGHGVWKNLDKILIKHIEHDKSLYFFMEKFLKRLGGGRELFIDFIKNTQLNFENSFLKSFKSSLTADQIPALTHRIWLTNRTNPSMPPERYIDNYLKMIHDLPLNSTHFFWTNSEAVRSYIDLKIRNARNFRVTVMDIELFNEEASYSAIGRLVADQKYVLAADILKMVILNRFGGIYSDLGIVYDNALFLLIQSSDYAFIVGESSFFQTSFFACAPGANIVSIFLAVMNNPSALDSSYSLMGPVVGPLDEVNIFSGPGLTVCAMLFLPESARTLIIPPQSPHLMWEAQQSWYGEDSKNGNTIVSKSEPSLIDNDQFWLAEKRVSAYSQIYGNIPVLKEQIRILLCTQPYFQAHPTKFCKHFFFAGSDKAQAWHNYGYFYNFIVGRKAKQINRMLEVGIGTNLLDVPSNMGATGVPGASLRAWKELLPISEIFGADVDKRILFQDDGIETYFVDQTQPNTIRDLFLNFEGEKFDLIVDDGLHTFEANRNLLLGAHSSLSQDGLYVVEDVPESDVQKWEVFLPEFGYDAAIIRLPHSSKASDNCLVLIRSSKFSVN
jgi:hypothetical protein